jgi:gluconokinase
LYELIKRYVAANENAVLACSALKRVYRKHLRVSAEVFLRGDYALVAEQLRHRRGHFMNPALLRSQFGDLEEPHPEEEVLTIELGRPPHQVVEEIKTKLRLTNES